MRVKWSICWSKIVNNDSSKISKICQTLRNLLRIWILIYKKASQMDKKIWKETVDKEYEQEPTWKTVCLIRFTSSMVRYLSINMNVLMMSLQNMFESKPLTASDDRAKKRASSRVNGIHMSDKIRFLWSTNIIKNYS